MNKKTDIEMRRAQLIDAHRTLIRWKHKWAANYEINELLPDSLEEFDRAVSQGNVKLLESLTIDFNDKDIKQTA